MNWKQERERRRLHNYTLAQKYEISQAAAEQAVQEIADREEV